MLPVILSIIAGLLLLSLLILAIPVTVTFSVQRLETFTNQVTIGWLFGRLRYAPLREDRVKGKTRVARREKKTVKKTVPTETEAAPARRPSDLAKAILKTRGFVKRTIRLLQTLIGAIRLRTLQMKGRIGLNDPYDTGRLWGLFSALTGIIHMKQQVLIQVEPDFNHPAFEIDGHGIIRIIPLQMIAITTLFLLSPPTIRAAWTAIKWSRRRKER
jgi:hypothetical protein